MDMEKTKESLLQRGFQVKVFESGKEAADYLDAVIDGVSVSFGGSATLVALDMEARLAKHNDAISNAERRARGSELAFKQKVMTTDVFLCSANAITENGEIVNIDGGGNRTSSTIHGHKKVYFVIGRNKIVPDLDRAIWRARNIAAPRNAHTRGVDVPCGVKGDKCYNCMQPNSLCREMVVIWHPVAGFETEVLLVNEDLGF